MTRYAVIHTPCWPGPRDGVTPGAYVFLTAGTPGTPRGTSLLLSPSPLSRLHVLPLNYHTTSRSQVRHDGADNRPLPVPPFPTGVSEEFGRGVPSHRKARPWPNQAHLRPYGNFDTLIGHRCLLSRSTNAACGSCHTLHGFFLFFWMRLYRALRGCNCGSRGFLEDRMICPEVSR